MKYDTLWVSKRTEYLKWEIAWFGAGRQFRGEHRSCLELVRLFAAERFSENKCRYKEII